MCLKRPTILATQLATHSRPFPPAIAGRAARIVGIAGLGLAAWMLPAGPCGSSPDNQWCNPLRTRRIAICGSLGGIVDNRVVHPADPTPPIKSGIERRLTGRISTSRTSGSGGQS